MDNIPYGYCHCGCSTKTNLATRNDKSDGRIKGKPMRFLRGHNPRLSGVAYIIEDRGHATPCWIWQRAIKGGYGRTWDGNRQRAAHRLFYERRHGPVPDGLELDHLCKQRACVNPQHLEPVTPAENVRRSHATKLTPQQVAEIRRLHCEGLRNFEITQLFPVEHTQISRILAGKRWAR